jgi:hypothetical protein
MYFLLSFTFSLYQNQRKGRTDSACKRGGDGGEVAQTMYTHVRKCKNYKIKGEKKLT